MPKELEEKLKKYLAGLTTAQIYQKIDERTFPFFGRRQEDCLDLAWEVISQRKLAKNA